MLGWGRRCEVATWCGEKESRWAASWPSGPEQNEEVWPRLGCRAPGQGQEAVLLRPLRSEIEWVIRDLAGGRHPFIGWVSRDCRIPDRVRRLFPQTGDVVWGCHSQASDAERSSTPWWGEGADWKGCRGRAQQERLRRRSRHGSGARVWGGGWECGGRDGCSGYWLHTKGLITSVHRGQQKASQCQRR